MFRRIVSSPSSETKATYLYKISCDVELALSSSVSETSYRINAADRPKGFIRLIAYSVIDYIVSILENFNLIIQINKYERDP
jgi:hypothetical protein